MKIKEKIQKHQIWKERDGKKALEITGKATGNGHWNVNRLDRKAKHSHIHEGTLLKFYNLI